MHSADTVVRALPCAGLQVGFKLDPTMFSNAEKQQLPMERCMRILPHQQVRLCYHGYCRPVLCADSTPHTAGLCTIANLAHADPNHG